MLPMEIALLSSFSSRIEFQKINKGELNEKNTDYRRYDNQK